MKTCEQVKIVEYHEGLAKGIAKMWNESRENWGGDSIVTTEEEVKEKEANSTNLYLFLALVGEEVVGYCGLSEYREDTEALYIPLLNVHPAYQGLKIGKQLVLKAVEKTVELNWPRLDLFTWAGNTKAVPLYKKCGFFWEDRENTTHLMNFIPMVLQIDWLKPFFEKHDWYTTSQRVIEVKPDGIKENDHTYYEYIWEAGEEFVRIQIERTGRAIRLIETHEILVEMKLPSFKLLEKEKHIVSYRIINKSQLPLDVSISGMSSELVEHNFNEMFVVNEEWSGEFPVKLTMPSSEPSPWKTHPVVWAHLVINGNQIPLKMGVFPKKAGRLHLRTVKTNWRAKETGLLYLDLESQLEEDSTWTIELPDNLVVQWEQSVVKTEIKGNTRLSIPLPIKLLKNHFLTEDLEVEVKRETGESFTFNSRLALAFPGYGAKFGGETEEYWYGYNGPYYVRIERRNHNVTIGSIRSDQDPVPFFTPKLGKPFSEDFSKKEASFVEYIEATQAFILKTSLQSDTFTPLILNTSFKIYGDGLVEIYHDLANEGNESKKDIFLRQPLYIQLYGLSIPQKDGVMTSKEASLPFIDYIRDKDISERWLFTSLKGDTKALSWPEKAVGKKDDWRFGIEYLVNEIEAKGKVHFGPIQVGLNTASTWPEWRKFVLGEEAKTINETRTYTLDAHNHNIVTTVGEEIDYSFQSMLTPYLNGKLSLNHEGETLVTEVCKEDAITKMNITVTHHSAGIKNISGNYSSVGQHGEVRTVQIIKGLGEVSIKNDGDNWILDNDVLTFKASSLYYPNIYSLTHKGKEIFDHQYPKAGPKAWWNPWGGGLHYKFSNVSHRTMFKEAVSIEPVHKLDQFGNRWSGLCLSTKITDHESMNGVVLRQFALTLPEVPVLVSYGEIHQGSGRTFAKEEIELNAFFKPAENLASCYAKIPTDGMFQTYYAGVEEVLQDTSFVTIGSDERSEKISVIHPSIRKMSEVYMNQEVLVVASAQYWSALSGEITVLKPTIIVIGDEPIHSSFAHQFQNISFK
ncbi:GNAT family N-acetyltransferase [Anaerobacillus isosaccharinicus]|uniref:GNAT family N-acetyltransferase n=1 Tax=Anaerobacillus isosaccharinicus TaxID=1532552 RepID=A0A1S2MBV6_9BACI|nr:GNAT family N-acetyltransferase [Anaerobacillus isosaccharinicus]MBA5587207.1 GNAT family N-acetyltransferase [Anaerobacillus isosaccharinicus]QOY34599.1 GNAT family N-acetyltransferase [Anaerobacillus isosaccharinicus]